MSNTANLSAAEALARLQEGNGRFMRDLRSVASLAATGLERRAQLLAGQRPFAIVLGCSDSRAPAEIVFDQGLGDLFVIRVAGNIVAPSLLGSVEFAAEAFGTRLVVVMGHSFCGAISATVDAVLQGHNASSHGITSIIDRIRPSVIPLAETELALDRARLARAAVRANVRASVDSLRHGSAMLEELAARDGLQVVGAEYDLESGHVDFFDT